MNTREWFTEAHDTAVYKLKKKYARVERTLQLSNDDFFIAHYTCLDRVSNIVEDKDHHLIAVTLINFHRKVAAIIYEQTVQDQFDEIRSKNQIPG
jgi:hypothetical protein